VQFLKMHVHLHVHSSNSPQMALKSIRHTPGYIYVIAALLGLPAGWFLVGVPGEEVPGMIAMVVCIALTGIFAMLLESLRRCIFEKHSE
jgi:hypothetical protein